MIFWKPVLLAPTENKIGIEEKKILGLYTLVVLLGLLHH